MRARERATTFEVENEIFREKKISSKIESNPKITFFYFIKNIVFKKFCCCGAAFEANKDFSVQCVCRSTKSNDDSMVRDLPQLFLK